MLNVQRSRGVRHREEINFTRKLMWAHMMMGAVVVAMFLFYEIFGWFAGSALWYAVSLVVMDGFMNNRKFGRVLLALVFAAGAGAGIFFLGRIFPSIDWPQRTLLPPAAIPLWVGMASLAYLIGAMFLLCDARVRRAGQEGFTL